MFQRLGVEDVNTRGTRIEVHGISAVVYCGLTIPVVEAELARHTFQGLLDHLAGDLGDLVGFVHLGMRLSQQLPGLGGLNLDTRVHQELVGFVQYALD